MPYEYKLLYLIRQLTEQCQLIENQIEDVKKSKRDGSLSIFQGLLDSSLPAAEKPKERLFMEARVILAAGTDTTATMMTKLIFHLLSNPDVLQKLKAELETAIPDANTLPIAAQVENLPYLVSTPHPIILILYFTMQRLISKKTAIIQETLRLHPSGSMRQGRFAPDEDLVYANDNGKKYLLPRGVSSSSSSPYHKAHPDLILIPTSCPLNPGSIL